MRSKSWNEFAQPGAPRLDFVFTVCDNAAGEMLPDLARSTDDGALGRRGSGGGRRTGHRKWLAFRKAFHELESRIKVFTSLPIRSLDRMKLQQRLHEIGRQTPADQVA